jgi:hypothetical protein
MDKIGKAIEFQLVIYFQTHPISLVSNLFITRIMAKNLISHNLFFSLQ